MATLNVNNDLLTVYNKYCNFVLKIDDKTSINLKRSSSVVNKILSFQGKYLGLSRCCATLSHSGKWYAVAEERNLIIWSTSNWDEFYVKVLERSASKIIFTPSDQNILVADKTGDVYLFSLSDTTSLKGTLILGHLSILLDITMTYDEKYIITCDRDEKIRVTCFPNTYSIQSFCLGHTAFVTKVLLINNKVLLSGSGDGKLKFWYFLEGDCVSTYSVHEDIADSSSVSADQCIVTNIVKNDDIKIICLSVHKYNGILIYKYNNNFNLNIIQKLECYEPLDFVLHEGMLWILKPLNNCILNALRWDKNSNEFRSHNSENIKAVLRVVNSECTDLINCPYFDLSVLCKKFDLKEKSKLVKCVVENTDKKLKTS